MFCFTVPKKAVGECFSLSLFLDIEKVWMRGWWGGGRVSRLSVENFLSHSAEKAPRATLYCVTNFRLGNILCFRGLCHVFSKSFLSHSAEDFCRGTH